MMLKKIDIEQVRSFIEKQSKETKIYIGGDSEKVCVNDIWYADYTLVVVIHIDGKHGCKVFGEVHRERDYEHKKNKPRMRLMTEVMKVAELYLKFHEVLEDRDVQIHLDINPSEMHGSSCVINEAIGYIRGTCNVVPLVKPEAFAASYAADRFKGLQAA
jgi:predicted RNase H-related nuclease YkuK (DUF458 family)